MSKGRERNRQVLQPMGSGLRSSKSRNKKVSKSSTRMVHKGKVKFMKLEKVDRKRHILGGSGCLSQRAKLELKKERQKRIQEEKLKLEEKRRLQQLADEKEEARVKENRQKGLVKLAVFSKTKQHVDMIYLMKQLMCICKESQVRETFALQLYDMNQKRKILKNLSIHCAEAKWKFKMARNFCKLFTPLIDLKLNTLIYQGFKSIARVKPKPFHRTSRRAKRASRKGPTPKFSKSYLQRNRTVTQIAKSKSSVSVSKSKKKQAVGTRKSTSQMRTSKSDLCTSRKRRAAQLGFSKKVNA